MAYLTIPAAPKSTAFHPYEPKWAEANTEAEFYHHARLLGLGVILRLATPVGQIDIATLRPDRRGVIAVVECKRNGRAVYGESNQIQRYKLLGVPVYGLNDFYRAESLVRTILERHSSDDGLLWENFKHVAPTIQRRKHYRKGPATVGWWTNFQPRPPLK